jgi:hypothetical protein
VQPVPPDVDQATWRSKAPSLPPDAELLIEDTEDQERRQRANESHPPHLSQQVKMSVIGAGPSIQHQPVRVGRDNVAMQRDVPESDRWAFC